MIRASAAKMLDSASPATITASQLQAWLTARKITSEEAVGCYLRQIEAHDGYLHAMISVASKDSLFSRARSLDAERSSGKIRGPLHGIPVLVKDNIATESSMGMDTTAGNMALVGSRPRKNATVVQRLLDAGAIIMGKANLSEFGWYKTEDAPSGWSAVGGQTQSAYVKGGFQEDSEIAETTGPGGSSSGPAVGVSAGYAPVAIGTETQGSLVNPASRAALFTMKPTIGIVSPDGVVPVSKFCDSPGPLARTAKDLAILMDVLVDSSTTKVPEGGYLSKVTGDWQGLKIGTLPLRVRDGIGKGEIWKQVSEQQRAETLDAYAKLREVASVYKADISLIPRERFDIDGQNILALIFEANFKQEMDAYLGSLQSSKVRTLEQIVEFNKENATIELPEKYPRQEFLEKAVDNAKSPEEVLALVDIMRRLGREEGLDAAFQEHDINILIDQADGHGLSMYAAAAGYPVASLPLGYLDVNGRPFGLAAVAPAHQEQLLVQLMSAWEAAFPARRPPPMPFGT